MYRYSFWTSRRTYDATLAELTSLEEMMRIMMEENHIHYDVIAKLWQVYSMFFYSSRSPHHVSDYLVGKEKPLPKPQRRGAIIILGMLALAKRSVLTDKVAVMLKVGLGPLGKVRIKFFFKKNLSLMPQADPTLARYTCVALQRLNGSVKKIKGGLRNLNLRIPWFHLFPLGSLLDKTLRIEMDNQIFRKLQTAVENPCRTKEWFGLAEQVINTVYALGEHPDNFCDELIKHLTIRAFSRPPKAAGEIVAKDPDAMNEDHLGDTTIDTGDVSMLDATQALQTQTQTTQAIQDNDGRDVGDAFELSQLLFVVGHVAIKQIVFLELIEREWKRQKDEKQTGWFCYFPLSSVVSCLLCYIAEKQATGNHRGAKDVEELDQVAGNAEDEIGERIAGVRESELLYGPQSLLALYGPMIVHICGSPHKFKVFLSLTRT